MAERVVRRQGQRGRYHDRDRRAYDHLAQVFDGFFEPVGVDRGIADANEKHKGAGEQSDIVVREDGQREGNDIQPELTVPEQGEGSRYHQRQQSHRIEPYHVPVIAHDEGAQGVHDAERGNRQVAALEGELQKHRERESREADLDAGDDEEELSEQPSRYEYREEVKRAREIIRHQGEVVGASAGLPSPQQRAAVLELVLIIHEEGIVLMPQVGDQYLVGAEGRDPRRREGEEHQYERHEEREEKIEPHAELARAFSELFGTAPGRIGEGDIPAYIRQLGGRSEIAAAVGGTVGLEEIFDFFDRKRHGNLPLSAPQHAHTPRTYSLSKIVSKASGAVGRQTLRTQS